MLESISIKNVALIKDITMEFGEGLNILLGETGAGKSIIFDALNFALGEKADKTLIRSGEEQMRVDVFFANLSSQTIDKLKEFGIDETEVSLTRVLTRDGKSTARINGIQTTTSLLKEVGECLLDSYSQHESTALLNPKLHLPMLDNFGDKKIKDCKEKVKNLYHDRNQIKQKIDALGGDDFERERTKSLLEYQINEIEGVELKIGEDLEILDRLKFLNSSEKIFDGINSCGEFLNGSAGSCLSSISNAISSLTNISNFENIAQCRERLESAKYEIEDVYELLRNIKASTEFDEKEFDKLDRRNDQIKSILKKYGGSTEKVIEYLSQIKNKLNELEDSEFLLQKYQNEYNVKHKELITACEELSNIRKSVAEEIQAKIIKELQELGMKSSQFKIKFERTETPTVNGIDKVEFTFSANKGQEIKALSKTASGGELSRFMLAVKNIFAEVNGPQTLVFDEIDSGISGETGNMIGKKLNNLARHTQILCITHLPQVACYGNSYFFISKKENSITTETCVEKLSGDKIPLNIAKMIVGNVVSDVALSQAQEMIEKTKK